MIFQLYKNVWEKYQQLNLTPCANSAPALDPFSVLTLTLTQLFYLFIKVKETNVACVKFCTSDFI